MNFHRMWALFSTVPILMALTKRFNTWLRKRSVGDYLFALFVILMIIPATRMPIQVQLMRWMSFAPSESSLNLNEPISTDDLDFMLMDEQGNLIPYSGLGNKKTFINLWATWCPPCVAELPSIEKLYQAMDQSMTFVLMSTEPIDKLKTFKESRGYSFPVYQIVESLPAWLSESNSIPATFIIDGSQKLKFKHYGAKKWHTNTFIDALKRLP